MVSTRKFSQFFNSGNLTNNDVTVGFGNDGNEYFNNPWTFLAEGATGDRPAPDPSMYFRLRLNTTTRLYEYYDPISASWVTVTNSISNVQGVIGTEDQVLVNGTFGVPQSGLVTLTLPQDLATSSSPTFDALTLNNPLLKDSGGTGVDTPTITPTSLEYAAWDSNLNLSANNHLQGYSSIATSGGTTILTVASAYTQFFTGSLTQNVQMPDVSTLQLGQQYLIMNTSTNTVTVQSSGGNTITAMAPDTSALLTCISNIGSTASSWNSDYTLNTVGVASVTGTPNQITATPSTGAVVLTLPQDIAPTSNITSNNLIEGYTSTVTAGGTTTLTVTSTKQQFFTGTLNQTVQMPLTSTLVLGQAWKIVNRSSGTLTVVSSGGNTITTVLPFSSAIITCILTSGTTNASWQYEGQPSIGPFNTILPTFSFITPGDLSVSYSTQNGRYQQLGNMIFWAINLIFTPTFTTSSGSATVTLTGAPNSASGIPGMVTSVALSGGVVFLPNSYVNAVVNPVGNVITFTRTTASASFGNLSPTAFPSGSEYTIVATGYYFV